jgi:hypothetical protein
MIQTIDKTPTLKQAQDGFAALEALTITSTADLELVNQSLHWATEQTKALEAELKLCTAPLREAEAKARSWFRPALDALGQLTTCLRGKLGTYAQAQAAANQAKLAAAAEAFKAGDSEQGIAAMAKVEDAPKLEGTSIKLVWTFEITEPDSVPRSCCSPDEGIIRARVKAGAREISGVRIYQTASTTVRRAK